MFAIRTAAPIFVFRSPAAPLEETGSPPAILCRCKVGLAVSVGACSGAGPGAHGPGSPGGVRGGGSQQCGCCLRDVLRTPPEPHLLPPEGLCHPGGRLNRTWLSQTMVAVAECHQLIPLMVGHLFAVKRLGLPVVLSVLPCQTWPSG